MLKNRRTAVTTKKPDPSFRKSLQDFLTVREICVKIGMDDSICNDTANMVINEAYGINIYDVLGLPELPSTTCEMPKLPGLFYPDDI